MPWICSVLLILALIYPADAHAIDKRLKLMFKTAGYGAAAGLLIGAGTITMGLGGYRNMLMGASSGMYAGILLAAYIVATPEENPRAKHRRNRYSPHRPIGPDDWENEPQNSEDLKENLPQSGGIPKGSPNRIASLVAPSGMAAPPTTTVWAPIISLSF